MKIGAIETKELKPDEDIFGETNDLAAVISVSKKVFSRQGSMAKGKHYSYQNETHMKLSGSAATPQSNNITTTNNITDAKGSNASKSEINETSINIDASTTADRSKLEQSVGTYDSTRLQGNGIKIILQNEIELDQRVAVSRQVTVPATVNVDHYEQQSAVANNSHFSAEAMRFRSDSEVAVEDLFDTNLNEDMEIGGTSTGGGPGM